MKDPGLPQGLVLTLALALFGAALLTATRRNRTSLSLQVRLFLVAIILRFALSVVIYQFGLVSVLKDEDASGWIGGVILYNDWTDRHLSLTDLPQALARTWEGHHTGYFYLLGLFFYLTGCPYRLAAAALNCFCGAITVVFVYRIAIALFSPWVATRAAWWTCVFPSMLIWSAMTLKEPVVILLETMALYGCVQVQRHGFSLRHLLLCATCIFLLSPFRFYASYLVGLTVILALALPRIIPRKGASLVLLGLLGVILVVTTGRMAIGDTQSERSYLARIESFRRDVSTGGAAVGARSGVRTADIRTPGGLVIGTAVGAAHLLLAPFPWQLGGGSMRMLLTLPELLVWWYLVWKGLLPGVRYTLRHRFRDVFILGVFILGFGLLYSMMFGNVGLVFRQRAQLLPWLLIFTAVGMECRRLARFAVRKPAHDPDRVVPLPGRRAALERGSP